jgi:DnaA family protein
MKQLALAMRLRERALFDSFVTGPNQNAVAQLRASVVAGLASGSAARTGAAAYWLAGPGGVGKTHLLQATCTLAIEHGSSAVYLPLSQLRGLGPEALDGWQQADVLALDDVPEVIGQRAWEQALFGLYREAEQRGARLLLAARETPARLTFALADLRSRLMAAMLLSVQPLDEPGQRQALQWRARARGLELPDETARYLQRRFRRDLATLCSLLDTIDLASLQAQRRLTVPFIRSVLAPSPPPSDEPGAE